MNAALDNLYGWLVLIAFGADLLFVLASALLLVVAVRAYLAVRRAPHTARWAEYVQHESPFHGDSNDVSWWTRT